MNHECDGLPDADGRVVCAYCHKTIAPPRPMQRTLADWARDTDQGNVAAAAAQAQTERAGGRKRSNVKRWKR